MENFNSLGLPALLLQSLEKMAFTTPTPIQAQTIPSALEGKDILGSAQTGTGKTAAFGIPLIASLLNSPEGSALILTPTRELAEQVNESLMQLIGTANLRTALLIGGEPMFKQLKALRMKPRIIVGTPGRINDHIDRGTLNLSDTRFLVLDETDRMLDMGFTIQIDKIIAGLAPKRQTLLFSATMAPNIVKLSGKYLTDAVRVSVGSTTTPTENVTQEVVKTSETDKYQILLDRVNNTSGSFIIFVKTKISSGKLATRLRHDGHEADAIHGDLHQRVRQRVIQGFRDGKHRILVATDVAARGLDIPHIEYVVNYDLPQCPEDYIHRIGRTGRAGAEGTAISLVTAQDGVKWRNICRLIKNGEYTDQPNHQGSRGGGNRFGGNRERRFDKPYNNDRSRSFSRSEGERSFSRPEGGFERKRFDRPEGERSFNRPEGGFERKRFDRPAGERSFSRPEGGFERKRFDRPEGERSFNRPEGGFERKRFDRPAGERSFNRPEGGFERKRFDRPEGERSFNRPEGGFERKRFDRPAGERSFSRPEGGFERKRFDRPEGDRPFGRSGGFGGGRSNDRPAFGDRATASFGRKKFAGRPDARTAARAGAAARAGIESKSFDRGSRSSKRSFGFDE